MKHKIYCISFVLVLFLMMPVTVLGLITQQKTMFFRRCLTRNPKQLSVKMSKKPVAVLILL